MIRIPPRSTLTATLFPYTTLFRSYNVALPKRAPVALFSFGELEASDLVRIRPRIKPSFPTGTPMLNRLLTGVFVSRNERLLKQLQRIVTRFNALEPQIQSLSHADLHSQTPEFPLRFPYFFSLSLSPLFFYYFFFSFFFFFF